jgi:hypothetical protein
MAWDPFLYGVTILAEFVRQKVGLSDWTSIACPTSGPGQVGGVTGGIAGVTAELGDLVKLVEYRQEVLGEALAQANDVVGYWSGLLMFSRYSHPWTFRLARIAIVVGEFVVMKLKRDYQRARPSQLSPALMPPIPVPGHASYPSGHATQAYLLSALMAQVMPSNVNTPLGVNPAAPASTPLQTVPPPPPTAPQPAARGSMLDRLAERAARNREVLGLHYRSDSEAGRSVAQQILPFLLACPSMSATASTGIIKQAKDEWPVGP